ncbi:MAG: methionine--tRNA ligase [Bacteroidota bacterium]
MDFDRHLITAALPYANGPIHIGHLAGVYIPADIYVRYLRSKGEDVVFVCGSDEHGMAITLRARKEGKQPQEIIDQYHFQIKESLDKLGISFSIYSRTSNQTHHDTASEMFKHLYDQGEFLEKDSEQFYDEEAKQFLADRYIKGECPRCGFGEAYGDQCENCGSSLSPTELINPVSTISNKKPVMKPTRHWYFPMDKYEPWLKKWILEGHKEWKQNVYGQCKSWLDSGLQPRAMTRDLDWGVKVPVEGADGKVLYVWFDAPIGYISATKEWAKEKGVDWEPYWKDKKTRLLHFIGKDNIVFHCIIFPSILKAHKEFILPDNVPANEFLNLEGNKISTSRNWAVWLHEYLEDFSGKEDVLRYTLTSNAPETKDNDFTWKDFQARNNNELVAILGNLVNRVVVLTHKYFDGKIPEKGEFYSYEDDLIEVINETPKLVEESLDQFRFREALSRVMDLARAGNKYLADTEPWKLIKTDPDRVETILNLGNQVLANLAIVMEPFLPFSSEKLAGILDFERPGWNKLGSTKLLANGHTVKKPDLMFGKLEDELIEAQIEKLKKVKEMNTEESGADSLKDEIVFDDFIKNDIRIATIVSAEKVKKSKKLLKIELDTGIDKRTVLSGIALHFDPQEIIGEQVTVLVNLAPRMMMGIESQGMILMAEDHDGKLRFLQPSEVVKNGSVVS